MRRHEVRKADCGVPEKTDGVHRPQDSFGVDRYNIVCERDLHDAGGKLATYMQTLDTIEALTTPAAKGDTDNSRTIGVADAPVDAVTVR